MKLRFAGDWLFYAMQLRTGKIAYLPESLNFYRRHQKTVTRQSVLGDTHAEETLHVKAQDLRDLPGPGRGDRAQPLAVRDGIQLLDRSAGPEAAGVHGASEAGRPAAADSGGTAGAPQCLRSAARPSGGRWHAVRNRATFDIHLANALAGEQDVFLFSARPQPIDLSLIGRVDERVNFLEGTLGPLPWPSSIETPSEPVAPDDPRRLAILEELIRFHRIDVIHSRSPSADRLVLQLNEELGLPWFVHAPGGDLDPDGMAARILGSAKGVFYEHERELAIFDRLAIDPPARLSRLLPGLGRVGHENGTLLKLGEEFRFFLAPAKGVGTRGCDDAIAAARIVNVLPAGVRGHRRARLVLLADQPAAEAIRAGLQPDDAVECRPEPEDPLAALARCHVALLPDAPMGGDAAYWAIAALACGRPVIAADRGAVPEIIAHEGREAGMLLPLTGRSSVDLDRLVAAMLAYLKLPEMYAAHRRYARQIFDKRFAADRIAATCVEAYLEACNVLAFPGGEESIPPDEAETATLPARRLA